MAPPTSSQIKPGRTLLVLLAIIIAMGAATILQNAYIPKFGLDLAGGTTVTLTPQTLDQQAPPEESLNRAVNIIRDRVNGTGISDAQVAKSGSNILIQIPGAGQEQAEKLVTTAELRFRQVLAIASAQEAPAPLPSDAPSGSPAATPAGTPAASAEPSASPAGRALAEALTAPSPSASAPAEPSASASPGAEPSPLVTTQASTPPTDDPLAGQDLSGIDPAVMQEFRDLKCSATDFGQGKQDDPDKQYAACDTNGQIKYILDKAAVKGTELAGASAATDPTTGEWIVQVDFKSAGATQFADVTRRITTLPQPRNQLATVLDGAVIVAPTINEAIPGGRARISGGFTQVTATELADQLKYGALPLKFITSSVVSVSSTLGADQLRGGLISGAIGLVIVMLYLLLYYRGLGLVGIASLGVATVVTYLSVTVLSENAGFRLSLPHIIGLVVSIGITADSFIVFFERMRDEMKEGRRSLRAAVEVAWRRARRTILVADAVMFIAAVVLYFLAVGDVAGFAFAMGLTTAIDVVVVFLFTKPLMSLVARTKFFAKGHKLSGLDAERMARSESSTQTMQEA
ncbi:protein translocase subunit SecD [Acrocarpospora phusangensis]|uniref:Protein translocase subunit SecD n=1 Tax=Acrocarpospora phusangensis TaxID=1070424 RepID=A0A919Q6P1_9ACTN|nr:protein translocase subunit SecD [Acrocarpospora phusangensis]GIH22928.1 protein translocase subunit SecD [Acrocarpospora phusangensis]